MSRTELERRENAAPKTVCARLNVFSAWLVRASWAVFLLCLPVTSFPHLPEAMGGGALVRPLSIVPLLVLSLLVVLPRLLRERIPRAFLPLLAFIAIALIASFLSLLRGIEPALGIPVTERVLRAVLTLAIGCAFYLATALTPRTPQDMKTTLRWLYAGFGVAMLWGTLQAVYILHFVPAYFAILNRLQRFISVRKLFHNRISGMTYEPNWFAEQLTFLLMPWLIASVLSGVSAFRWRWRRVTVEMLLLGWLVILLPFTYSRAGLLNLVVLAFVGLVFFRHPPSYATSEHLLKAEAHPRTRWKGVGLRVAQAVLALVVVASLMFFAGRKNPFFARLWGYWTVPKERSIGGYFEYLGFGARFTYSETAFRIYEAYPAFGVGLGNYAFYFAEQLPERSLALTPEILRLVTPEEGRNRLITAKNFYFRLLSETGLAGTVVFTAFAIAILGVALYLWLSPDPRARFWGAGGLLGFIAFLLAALSFDSFAIPNMWIIFGLITAAGRVYRWQEPTAIPGLSPGANPGGDS